VETCAAIGLVLFAHQMLLINLRDIRYAQVMECALYNAVLVGMSLDGKSFFYENPLATVGKPPQRSEWFEVSCCPPNVRFHSIMSTVSLTVMPGGEALELTHQIYVHVYPSGQDTTRPHVNSVDGRRGSR
jgi:uncharacterized protein